MYISWKQNFILQPHSRIVHPHGHLEKIPDAQVFIKSRPSKEMFLTSSSLNTTQAINVQKQNLIQLLSSAN